MTQKINLFNFFLCGMRKFKIVMVLKLTLCHILFTFLLQKIGEKFKSSFLLDFRRQI